MDSNPTSQVKPDSPPPSESSNNHGLESVKDAIGSIFVVVKLGMVLLAIAFCFSGIKHLEQYEEGILVRFGKVHEEVKKDPGLVFALPYPVDELIKVPAKRTQSLESTTFWYKLTDTEAKTGIVDSIPATLKPGLDGYLITADRNILHAKSILKYRIRNPVTYTFKAYSIQKLIRVCLDNALIKAIGTTTAVDVLRDKNKFAQKVTALLARQLQEMDIGVEIDPVDIRLSWPRQLADNINQVVKAKQQYEQNSAAAKVYARSQEDSAESQAHKVKVEANTWATQRISRIQADAATFKKMYPLYRKNPSVIKQILYQDRMKKIMADIDEIFLIEPSDDREIRINIQRKEKPGKNDGKS